MLPNAMLGLVESVELVGGTFRARLICWRPGGWLYTGSVGIGIWNHQVNRSATPLVMGILERSGPVQYQCLKS